MMHVFEQSLELMWKGMGAIFVVIFVIYLILLAFPKVFGKAKDKK
ncbi:MAG: OadG-related small transporter subunit [Sphaerochaetaceae bacterium]